MGNIHSVVFIGAVKGQALFDKLIFEWRQMGLSVDVWSEISEHDYRNASGLIARLWMRFRVNVIFVFKVLCRILVSKRGKRYIVTSTPWVLPAIVGLAKSKRDTVVHMVYDLYPDAFLVAGKIGAGSVLHGGFAYITKLAMKMCDISVFPGARLREHADRVYGPCRKSGAIPVGTDAETFEGSVDHTHADTVKVVYVGNFGYMHDYTTLAELLRRGLPAGVVIEFYASGKHYELLKSHSSSWAEDTRSRVFFGRPLGHTEWKQTMLKADVGLVLFADGAERVAFPSKTYSAMAAGQAILAVAPLKSDLADVIVNDDAGWVSAPGKVDQLKRNLEICINNLEVLRQKQLNAKEASLKKYDMKVIAREWINVMQIMNQS